jgi:hypothetical protein
MSTDTTPLPRLERRRRSDAADAETVREMLLTALRELREEDGRNNPGAEARAEEHAWVRAQINREMARAEFIRELTKKSLPVIVLSLLGALGTGLWHFVQAHWKWG